MMLEERPVAKAKDPERKKIKCQAGAGTSGRRCYSLPARASDNQLSRTTQHFTKIQTPNAAVPVGPERVHF